MFQPDRYSFIPPLEKRHIPIVALWIVVVIIAALISSRGASASPIVFGSPLPSPLATPAPQPLVVSFSPAAGSRDVPRHTALRSPFASIWIAASWNGVWRSIRRSAARSNGRAARWSSHPIGAGSPIRCIASP
jgi:hypothetical protein